MTRYVKINRKGDKVPISLDKLDEVYVLSVNWKTWAVIPDRKAAVITYRMMEKHLRGYKCPKKFKKGL